MKSVYLNVTNISYAFILSLIIWMFISQLLYFILLISYVCRRALCREPLALVIRQRHSVQMTSDKYIVLYLITFPLNSAEQNLWDIPDINSSNLKEF